MRFVRALVLASALVSATPLLAEGLSASAVKAFTAKMDEAVRARDLETVIQHIAEHCVISGTAVVQGQMRTFRMNKTQYRQMLTLTYSAATNVQYDRTNEKISIDGDQAIVTADVVESMVIQGRQVTTKVRERATVENLDGTLMLTQLVAHQVL